MTWPAGQQNGLHIYREMKALETPFTPLPYVLAPTTAQYFVFPWSTQGYTDGRFSLSMTASAGGVFALTAQGVDSDGGNGLLAYDLVAAAIPVVAGVNILELAWDDGVWPGNWQLDNAGVYTSGSMTLNPVWSKNFAAIKFNMTNNSVAANITIVDFNLALRG
ncbi:MAG: hypothetical protein ACREJM_00010 [Candidatus Saccharimonadales bacterium]